MSIKGEVTGSVVAVPEDKKISEKLSVFEFPLYSDRRVKNRETGEWENDPTGVSKIRISAKFDARDQAIAAGVAKGDLVKVVGTFYERGYENKEGVKGRSLEADYIESIEIVSKSTKGSGGSDGFDPGAGGGF